MSSTKRKPTTTAETPEPKIPTKAEIVKFLQEQIEVKELQARLQHLNRNIAIDRADELEALAKVAHFSNQPSNADAIQHKVTEQDLINNPSLADQDIKAGDIIGIPKDAMASFVFETPVEETKTEA